MESHCIRIATEHSGQWRRTTPKAGNACLQNVGLFRRQQPQARNGCLVRHAESRRYALDNERIEKEMREELHKVAASYGQVYGRLGETCGLGFEYRYSTVKSAPILLGLSDLEFTEANRIVICIEAPS